MKLFSWPILKNPFELHDGVHNNCYQILLQNLRHNFETWLRRNDKMAVKNAIVIATSKKKREMQMAMDWINRAVRLSSAV